MDAGGGGLGCIVVQTLCMQAAHDLCAMQVFNTRGDNQDAPDVSVHFPA